jgi:DNA-directed RNA polymerase alpha subunit
MKAQAPAEGIMKTGDYGDSKFYKVVCGCGDPNHDIDFEVEADDIGVNVNTHVTIKTDYWSESVKKRYDIDNPYLQELDWTIKDIWNGLATRLKLTWNVWTTGYIKTETTIAMTEQQALNYSETLKSAISEVKAFKQKFKSQSENKKVTRAAQEGDCV